MGAAVLQSHRAVPCKVRLHRKDAKGNVFRAATLHIHRDRRGGLSARRRKGPPQPSSPAPLYARATSSRGWSAQRVLGDIRKSRLKPDAVLVTPDRTTTR